ncbi:uncharacterized protein LOC120350308 [Nilaparvata lugens]|uniref:uncharacterized protein LOC120350308 n=1 Tax=Nilaparvata lugens TaxID=108931 RepID=UPI00193D1513|nr:uncharacterized protein LOC120350308 [Nilaparvata lugens]
MDIGLCCRSDSGAVITRWSRAAVIIHLELSTLYSRKQLEVYIQETSVHILLPSKLEKHEGQKAPLTEKQERVHSALNKMLAMGFSNEGGWLENILDQQDASIERVLEMLLPPSVVGRVVD